ncbi:diguanylate cyclase (GGDEF)-like protein [Kineothrix alysoides]|uniref:Diguanylate cyclase (GGDEF)-like protein n=1 Tax=Kineothrix alysoides TaxID=1469948 RepID=A0A4R1QZK1_9FIRM|nr:bifunctional diguanylate cyclase/phosphodiesterase [Kineothrix alysoides]TCL58435.1 diguanylate cyclase (GGDEF)-like protein [Kineothrix alysoides]
MDELQYQFELLNAMNQKLSVDEKMFQMLCNTSSSAFLYYNFEDDIIRTFGNWKFFFKVNIQEIRDISGIYDFIEDKYVLQLRELLFIEKKGRKSDSAVIRMKDGIWVECETAVTYDENENAKEKVIRFKNITKFKNQNEELTYMAYYDVLTGLYNRNYFILLLGDYVRKAEEERASVAVMFIDIDDFRKINDGLGIVIGDEIVQQFGQFLSSIKNNNVIVSHFNSDIYCIAIYDPCGARSVEHIFRMIHERLQKPFLLSNGMEVNITVSMGVAEYPEAAKTTLELINCAEIVMFKAKSKGKDSIQYFDVPILNDFLQNVTIENKLKEAAFSQNFMMYFQPQYHAQDRKLRGVEALIRWKDDDGHMISPSVFIPIAEKNGTIIPIGTWVIEESIRIYSQWKKKYKSDLILSLNISAIQYRKLDFVSKLMKILKKYEVKPTEVELEITESVLIDDFGEITNKLVTLRSYGIRISLDDFGTGYSSLSYLKGLPIDTLKIDKSFIDTVVSDDNTKIITESIIYMVKKLGFETVAEGVETKEQFEYLKSIECDNIQGFFLGKPMPSDEVEELLKQAVV